ncbi:MAG: hypothetical protein K5682_00115 [Lachnospiraceae bacterium]|nr:hypothetical protein [Lachnospiraceae bacterium]
MATSKRVTRTGLLLIAMAVAVVAYFYHLTNRAPVKTVEAVATPVQELLLKDYESNYPQTPKEVLKAYNNIMQVCYNQQCSDEELVELADLTLLFFDQELAEANPNYYDTLKNDVTTYRENDCKISSYSLSAATDVDYYIKDNFSFARLSCIYNIRISTQVTSYKQIYLLRKDDDGHWKIYGWKRDQGYIQ